MTALEGDPRGSGPAIDKGLGKGIGKRILLLSAYDAHSHQQWRTTLAAMFPDYDWTTLSLPPRHFSWRARGNSLSWAFNHRPILTDNYDLLIATSLVDLSSLRGFVPELARVPTLVYFHENQFAYPPSLTGQQQGELEVQIVSLYTALCADRIAFNSDWNRRSFYAGLSALLKKLPDHVPPGLCERLQKISQVLPVALPDSLFNALKTLPQNCETRRISVDEPLQIVWNHRHEYDKGPALLLTIVQRLCSSGLPFRLHLLGQRFRQEPAEFRLIREQLAAFSSQRGIPAGEDCWLAERQDYEALLQKSDVVLSTALHDFQGLSILEAVALGCVPLTPNALAYPEYIPPSCLYEVDGLPLPQQAENAVARIVAWYGGYSSAAALPEQPLLPFVEVSAFAASTLKPAWSAIMQGLTKSGKDLSPQNLQDKVTRS